MKELEKLLNLGNDYKIDKQEVKEEKGITYKVIYISCKKSKDCGKYTNSVHDKLKQIDLKGLKIM